MREPRRRFIPFSITGITRRTIFGTLLLAIVATPAALDLCAKDKRRAKAAKEQKQNDAAKAQPAAKESPDSKDALAKDPVTKDPDAKDPVAKDPAAKDPAAKDPVAKDLAVTKEQKQDDVSTPTIIANAPVVAPEQTKGKDESKEADPAAEKSKDPAVDKAKNQETDKAKSSDKPKTGDKTSEKVSERAPEKTPEKSTVARTVDDRTRPVVSLKEPKPAIAPALEAARGSREALRKIPGYTCTFSKQEQLKKGAAIRHTMSLKFRREPFSVYLKYVDPSAGREVIYVEGRNNGKLQVHEASGLASLIGTISVSPTGNEAMKENKYPLTMIGMEKMLERFIADWEESQKHADTKVQHYPQAKLGEVECLMYEVAHPEKREPFKFHMSRVYFDKKTLLPIRAEQYAFPAKSGAQPLLVEEYTYSDVKADASLSETDFDVKNEKYGFK